MTSILAKAEPDGKKLENLKATIKDFLCKHFDNIDIQDIIISRRVDEDDFEFLRVKVILRGKGKLLDPERSVNVIRLIRPRLMEIEENGFPVISYIPESDMERSGVSALN